MTDKKNYLITTADGTSTLFLDEYEQAMHSDSGAYEESLLKHIYPSGVLELEADKIDVLDAGFGLGYNVLALINEFKVRKNPSSMRIISLEKERYLLDFMNEIRFSDSRDEIYDFIKKVYGNGKGTIENISFEILFGDGRESIKKMEEIKFDAVFQDPFSPSKNPEMWSVDYFCCLKQIMSEKAILTTYSSADHIRRAMLEAGFIVGAGPSVGRKREGTIASISAAIKTLDSERLRDITDNPRSEPYRDTGLCMRRDEILSERLNRIKEKKRIIR
ncbi:MAG TPA: MnmC family methyltransferase [Spirochaetota bacterium]|nr:MnmC family methyltransferase [Spirochaetota bacterium]